LYKRVWESIKEAESIVLVSHINPDGDTLGSALAMQAILKKMGKKSVVFSATKDLPLKFDFLPGFKKIKNTLPTRFDLIVSFDCASFDRLGIERVDAKIINIDHHKSNTKYGDINLIKDDFVSCSVVVYEIFEQNSVEIDKDVALCIYTALVEDSGFFSYERVDAKTFKLASKLCEKGVIPSFVSKMTKERVPLCRLRLTQELLSSMTLLKDATVARAFLTQESFKKSAAPRNESENLVNILRSLATVELGILFLEEEDGRIKVSLRSKDSIDVSKIALRFGGGGHKRAAGFETEVKDIEKLTKMILEVI
jgi:phosphoesterase RecJ-like protein